jgi:biotin carboxyl carrier protein
MRPTSPRCGRRSRWATTTALTASASARRDREAIDRLADEVLPSLIARFGASDLGELEVKRGGWRPGLPPRRRRGSGQRLAPASVGKGGEGKRLGARRPRQPARQRRPQRQRVGQRPGLLAAVGPGRRWSCRRRAPSPRACVHLPAVGYFTAREGIAAGVTVRGGDVLGHVDVLGVRQEVVAPADGIVARVMAEQGEAVEYGQELVRLDPAPRAEPAREG